MRVRCPECGTINQLPAERSAPTDLAICSVCRMVLADSESVVDDEGRYCHRHCYDESRRPVHQSSQETRSWPPGHLEPPPDVIASPAKAPRAIPVDEIVVPEPARDGLWNDLTPSDSTGSISSLLQPLPATRPNTVWLYVMMGFAAAVPVVVLLFILVQLIVYSLEANRGGGLPPVPTLNAPSQVSGPGAMPEGARSGAAEVRSSDSGGAASPGGTGRAGGTDEARAPGRT